MIPERIRPFFKTEFQKNKGDSSLTAGILTCCDSHNFEVFAVGEIRRSIFSGMYLIPQNDEIILEARCKKCGRVITVFDSRCDGYEQWGNIQPAYIPTQPVNCKKCHDSCFSVHIEYEYPDEQELEELNITELPNAFTWIWVTLKCSSCGAVYKNFIDCETA